MTNTLIAAEHAHVRGLMRAIEYSGGIDAKTVAISGSIALATAHVLRTPPEDVGDALLQIDLALNLLEAEHSDATGTGRYAIEASMVTMANAAAALSFASGVPLPSEESVSDLADFVSRASLKYLQPTG